MREIKLRAWNKKNEKWLDSNEWAFDPETSKGWYLERGTMMDIIEDIIIIQSTGLKDKDGKEIYEGDIIEYALTDNKEKIYKDKVFWFDDYCGFEPFVSYDSNWPIYVDLKTIRIIGNIYENPELIDKK